MMLWLAGSLGLASAFVVYGWAVAAWQHRHPLTHWNAALVLAIALDVSAVSFASIMGMRTWQLIIDDLPVRFWSGLMATSLCVLLVSKVMLVWVASIAPGRKITLLWPVFWASFASWTGFCVWWGI